MRTVTVLCLAAATMAGFQAAPNGAWADQAAAEVTGLADPSISEHQLEFRPLLDMPADEGFVTQLLLMRSHLNACMELHEIGAPDQAAAHCSHPLDELYGDLSLQLDERGLPGFAAQLNAVVESLRSNRPETEFLASADGAAAAIDSAIAAIDPTVRSAPGFAIGVVTGLLRAAASDYEASLVDGRVANLVEYQDSRAFLEQARRLVEDAREPLEARDAAAFAGLEQELDGLTRLLPLEPSTDAASGTEQVAAIIDRVDALQTSFR